MYKRLELHNHTIESDGNITTKELIEHMVDDGVDAFALTDHNTISCHYQAKELLDGGDYPIECIYGMEYTTYYGHILCFNLKEYVPWENINRHKPELLFKAVQEKGAIAGIAHPFSEIYPKGTCGFDMTITDFSSVDFIEIINNPESLHEVNKPGILWWEDLILKGHRIAATCGMDLHNKSKMNGQFATFIKPLPGEKEETGIEAEIATAISKQETWVSKGPILEYSVSPEQKEIIFTVVNSSKSWDNKPKDDYYTMTLRTQKETLVFPINTQIPRTVAYSDLDITSPIIPKLYAGEGSNIENLVCVSPVIYL